VNITNENIIKDLKNTRKNFFFSFLKEKGVLWVVVQKGEDWS
jgi:hypothetical protein